MIHLMGMPSPTIPGDTSTVSSFSWTSVIPRVLNGVRNRLWYCRELRVYRYPLEERPQLPLPTIFRRNCLDDLRYYQRSSRGQRAPNASRRMADERMAQGFHLYTFVESGRLLHYCWLIERQTRGEDGWVEQVYFPPSETAVLFDHFTHPLARGRGL